MGERCSRISVPPPVPPLSGRTARDQGMRVADVGNAVGASVGLTRTCRKAIGSAATRVVLARFPLCRALSGAAW